MALEDEESFAEDWGGGEELGVFGFDAAFSLAVAAVKDKWEEGAEALQRKIREGKRTCSSR